MQRWQPIGMMGMFSSLTVVLTVWHRGDFLYSPIWLVRSNRSRILKCSGDSLKKNSSKKNGMRVYLTRRPCSPLPQQSEQGNECLRSGCLILHRVACNHPPAAPEGTITVVSVMFLHSNSIPFFSRSLGADTPGRTPVFLS